MIKIFFLAFKITKPPTLFLALFLEALVYSRDESSCGLEDVILCTYLLGIVKLVKWEMSPLLLGLSRVEGG